ncbi:efflux RND transporter permease subunit [Sphingomonas mucosissima]|uniref:Swarming motility protein SwrC n=1 Tax=Sphingomonas mucosissima TaxID=370959 RepID=A0A245ZJR0_9SPHN|nr:efflux RND transporter permease subunit [Sphingomonas mucosissima]OWK29977.1 swarming motility protein SwrC [Sphingomonas mucosissima]
MSDRSPEDGSVHEAEQQHEQESEEVRAASRLKRFFFLKTTFGLLMTAILLIGGLLSYGLLVKEALPDLDIPAATITTAWPGADARSIEEQVTEPIEEELTSLSGVKALNSASYDSFSVISVEFDATVNTDAAMNELRAAVSTAESELPEAAEQPSVTQISVDDRPILTLALHGSKNGRVLSQVGRDIQDRLERITGVDEVTLGGEREDIVQILLQPDRLLALGISPSAIRTAVQQANIQQPFGQIESNAIGATVRLEGRFDNLDDLRALPILRPTQDGVNRPAVRLDEVASVRRMPERETQRAFFTSGGAAFAQSLELSITKTPGADTVDVVDEIVASMDEMERSGVWPQGIHYSVVQNGAQEIWNSLGDVFSSGMQSMLIVFVILFVTIAWREALLAGLSIPITFAGVLLFLMLTGQTLNELVIIGMVIALVLIIDVFIILLEGLHDEIYVQKATFGQAVLRTVKRYAVPTFAAQLTTILALVPLMAIGGTAGAFIRILPVTTVLCLVVGFVLAMFGTLPLSRYLLGKQANSGAELKEGRSDRVTARAMDWLENWNSRHVLATRKRAGLWVIGAFVMFGLSIAAFTMTKIELYPMVDAEQLGINIELPPTTPLAETQQIAERAGEILRNKTYLANSVMLVGRKSPFAAGSVAGQLQPDEAENFIGFSSIFTDQSERDGLSFEVAEELRGELRAYLDSQVPGAVLQVVPQQRSPTPGDPVVIEVSGPEIDTLLDLSAQVRTALRRGGSVVDVRDNVGALNPEIGLRPNREAANFFGITETDLAGQLRAAFSSDEIGTFATGAAEDDLEIRLGTEWPSRPGVAGPPRDLSELAMIRAYTQQGRSVSLAQLVTEKRGEGPIAISRASGERAVSVLARNQGRTVTEIIDDITPTLDQMKAQWPAGYSYTVRGEAEETGDTFGSAGIALAVAIMLVVGVLVIMFDSYRQALIIVATMPLAIIGAFLGFFLFGLSFSFFAMIGVVSLIGIVVNTGIIMVDTMNDFLRGGATVAEAAAAGAARRLRPVLTTAATTIIGLIPLAIGSNSYRPLTLVIIFGLITATILSLFVVPALYLLLTKQAQAGEAALD